MKKTVLHVPLTLGSPKEHIHQICKWAKNNHSAYTCFANVHMIVEANSDDQFLKVVQQADLVVTDGVPLTWLLNIEYGIKQERVAGMDLLPELLKESASQHIPVYFFGGTEEMLVQTRAHLQENYPGLQISGMYSPPFKPMNVEEEEKIINTINASGAQLVIVVLGCPKQEKWMSAMKGKIFASMIGIGGALPVMIGLQNRAPRWMQNAGLEWLFRLYKEPVRLFKRYFVTNSLFIFMASKQCISNKFSKINTVKELKKVSS
jgi:N-acetylglucosaminyldiphosphoundecaprenol N-acetyl-beta-D-mannosaminyltransferase